MLTVFRAVSKQAWTLPSLSWLAMLCEFRLLSVGPYKPSLAHLFSPAPPSSPWPQPPPCTTQMLWILETRPGSKPRAGKLNLLCVFLLFCGFSFALLWTQKVLRIFFWFLKNLSLHHWYVLNVFFLYRFCWTLEGLLLRSILQIQDQFLFFSYRAHLPDIFLFHFPGTFLHFLLCLLDCPFYLSFLPVLHVANFLEMLSHSFKLKSWPPGTSEWNNAK